MKIPALSTPTEFLAHAAAGRLGNLTESSAPWATRCSLEESRKLARKAWEKTRRSRAKIQGKLEAAKKSEALALAAVDEIQAAICRMIDLENK